MWIVHTKFITDGTEFILPKNYTIPVGMVLVCPEGFKHPCMIECNGQSVDKVIYKELYKRVGDNYTMKMKITRKCITNSIWLSLFGKPILFDYINPNPCLFSIPNLNGTRT